MLLVHAKNFRGQYKGLVAGFLEAGETLEECIRREVMEETELKIKNLRYFGSQPWPYPSGIMIGFIADYESGTQCRRVLFARQYAGNSEETEHSKTDD